MNKKYYWSFMLSLILSGWLGYALAEPSCTTWLKQPDGTEFRTCVNDAGKQYCEQKNKDGTISAVKCN